MTDETETAWYPTTCPTWCDGDHPALLMPSGADPDEAPDAAELVVHSHTITDPDRAEDLTVTLDQDEGHPDSLHGITAGPARVHVWLPDNHDEDGADPDQLRRWATILATAAESAASLIGNGQ